MILVEKCKFLGKVYFDTIVENFGREILLDNGELDRKKLRDKIFSDYAEKEKLDKLTSCYVVPKIKKEAILNGETGDVVIDAALLFEFGLDEFCDITIGVIASLDTLVNRICKRDSISEESAKLRIESQKNNNFFKSHSDYVIINEDWCNIEEEILSMFNRKKFI